MRRLTAYRLSVNRPCASGRHDHILTAGTGSGSSQATLNAQLPASGRKQITRWAPHLGPNRAENRRLCEDVEILKRATAIFATASR